MEIYRKVASINVISAILLLAAAFVVLAFLTAAGTWAITLFASNHSETTSRRGPMAAHVGAGRL